MDTSQDSNTNPSPPSKGKGVETNSKNWRAGWWDFYPLLERPKRPLQWSQSSIIFTAHPTQPIITGRHFSSSKQFVLPSPPPIMTSPASYDPPTVISASPCDAWLLAYFPRRDGEGTGCLWKRGPHVDNWIVKECWSLPKGGGIVAASWLGNRREWVAGASGIPIRLPVRGPAIPISDATLLLVTQDNYVHLSYIRHYSSGLKTLKRSLIFFGVSTESSPSPMDVGENANSTRQCVEAAIGIGYNENTIFIATHSRRVPPPGPTTLNAPAFDSMDLSVTRHLTSPDQKTAEWENWGEERTIELYEVQIRFDSVQMALGVFQLSTLDCPTLALSGLTFICTPPRPNPPQTPLLDATSSPSQPKVNPPDKGKIGLVATYVNFHNYTKPPTSTLTLYSLALRAPNSSSRIWAVLQTATRLMESGIVTHIEPFIDFSGPSTVLMHACVLDTSGSFVAGKSLEKDTPIGTLKVLNIPNLTDNINWGSTPIKSSKGTLGKDLPLIASLSPNRRLFCTLSSSLWQNQTAVYALPLPEVSNTPSIRLPLALATAILGRTSTADLIHAICSPAVSVAGAASILYQTLDILDKHYKSEFSPNVSTWDVLGMATEVYRTKALLSKNEKEAEDLTNRWETAHDICLLAACNVAFEDCKEGDGYDLEAVWQMIGMCTWVINFTEKLMKACVLSSNATIVVTPLGNSDSETLAMPILLHLCHPFSLQNVFSALRHVKAFRFFLGSLPAGSEHSQIAQTMLVDAVDSSGVDLGNLISLLEEYLEPLRNMDPQECRHALAACRPTPVMQPHLGKLLQHISDSETLLNKSTLFIKPSDLIDGVARLSLGTQPKIEEKDVVSKAILLKQEPKDVCLRCGGKTAMGREVTLPRGHFHSKWHLFELKWQLRCICGGPWSLPSIS
ncbi:hypothetical protein GALMADRAFT_239795 [Galerina marginata CBS 339.88]|uniref:Mediator complex subunit 16 n=1 Tax=Galerina marginata (strain CBS 339.88) TaxID=685588 RepID=A0A067TP26_GALM3|nr:hypothetical protein GALMADRAFT_239795 [Galerina marginata CBS 339.88]